MSDAEFIPSPRTDTNKSRYLNATENDVHQQRQWLERYINGEGQAYFIIEFEGEAIGTVRLYDAQENSFYWGSWILKGSRPQRAAMELALMIYSYAVDRHQQAYLNCSSQSCPLTETIHNEVLSLPICPVMDLEAVKKVIKVVNQF